MSTGGSRDTKNARTSPDGISGQADSTLSAGIVLLALIVVGLIGFYLFIRRKSKKLQFVLIVGRNNAGKTALFVKLTENRVLRTVSSLAKNVAWTKNLIPEDETRRVQLIDVPGFERVRWEQFENSKSLCKGIVFVVDSLTITRDSQECADILYRILSDPEIQRRKVPVLIACNKQDEVAAKDIDVIREILEKELNSIRITKFNPSTKKGNRSEYIGSVEKDFTFHQLIRTNKIDFVSCFVKNGEKDESQIEGVVDFLRTLA